MGGYVGIDLAWGTRAATGLAVVGEDGALLASATVRTDDEIVAWLASTGVRPVVVGVDAPLVVTNRAGMRDCERAVSRAFGAYGASCHASSRARPVFDPPRAEVLARRCGWEVDPAAVGTIDAPVAIEVYPHAAMIGLFALGSVIPYKAKRGRDVAARKQSFGRVLELLEGLPRLRLDRSEAWARLRSAVLAATRHVHLERVEDEIDAVLCAHLAWLWAHRPGALEVYGDRDGYIVAPPRPSHPRVSP